MTGTIAEVGSKTKIFLNLFQFPLSHVINRYLIRSCRPTDVYKIFSLFSEFLGQTMLVAPVLSRSLSLKTNRIGRNYDFPITQKKKSNFIIDFFQ